MAAALQARGVGPGVHVGVLGPTSRPLVTAIQAVYLAGGTVVALPLPMRLGSIEEFVEQTRRRIANADAALGAGRPATSRRSSTRCPTPPTVGLLDELAAEGRARRRRRVGATARRPRAPRDPAVHERLDRGAEGRDAPRPLRRARTSTPSSPARSITHADRAVSWLPLYHDMGLIGLLMTPMLHGFELVLGAPQDFLARPACWLEWISEFRGTITAGPNFSYALAARARCDAPVRSTCRAGGSRSTAPRPSTRARSSRSAPPPRRSGSTPAPRTRCSAWPRPRSRSRSPRSARA